MRKECPRSHGGSSEKKVASPIVYGAFDLLHLKRKD